MIISKSPLSLNNEVYIVLEGGGARGTAFAGALSALEELNIKPLAVVGTSAGAIAAAFIAVGYSSKEISQLMYDKDFQEFLDPVCRIPAWRWLVAQKKQGFYKGDHFQKWLEEKLSQRLLGKLLRS
jgi:NTE family protein